MFGTSGFVSMWEIYTKLLLWLLTTFIVTEEVHSKNSCPEFSPYYCACSWTDIAEVRQLKMCLYEDVGEGNCHPCPESSQENVNCDSCDDNKCPICLPLNFDRGKASSSYLKQPVFFRFNRHGGVLHTRPFSLHGHHNLNLQNAKYHNLDDLHGSNSQTATSKVFFSRSKDSSDKHSQVKISTNMPENTLNFFSNAMDRREKSFNFPRQESSRMHYKKLHHSKLMDDEDFKMKSSTVLEERKNAKPVELLLEKLYIPELTLPEKRNDYVNLNDPNFVESDIGKLKFRKRAGKNKNIYLLHKLPSDKVKLVSFENIFNNEQKNLVKHMENDPFVLSLRPVGILDNGEHILHRNIPGKIKTHGVDKYYFQNVPGDSDLDDTKCSFTSEPSKISFNDDYTVDLSAIEKIEEDIQKCISKRTKHEKLRPFETSCNISLSQAVLFKCVGSEIGKGTDLSDLRIREIIKMKDSNFTDKIEVITEITNVSLEHPTDSDKSIAHDKTTDNSLNGKINVEIRFSLKEFPYNFFSHFSDQDVFRKHDLPVEDNIEIESHFIDNKFKNNHLTENWVKKSHLKDEMNNVNPNVWDSEAKKNDIFINTTSQKDNKTRFLDFLDSLFFDNKAKNNKLQAYHIKFDDEIENTDLEGIWKQKVYYKPEITDKETESENVFENSMDKIEEPFAKIRELFITDDLSDATKITNSPNSKRNFHLKRVIRDISHFLSSRSLKDTQNFDKIIMTQQSTVQLFSLNQGPAKSQNSPGALLFQYRKSAKIPNINEIVNKKNMKKSDIFKLLNVSISSLKKSNMYSSDCETCSVMYKIMLDSGFKNDPKLTESVNSSVVVLMRKPQFNLVPHKSKMRVGNQRKNKKSTKNVDSFIIQMDTHFLFLSFDDYEKLNRKNKDKKNPLRNSPWADMKNVFVFKIPDSFSPESKIMELTRSLKRKNLKPIVKVLLNQEFTEELQQILFAILSKMHEQKTKRHMENFDSSTLILPTINSLRTKFNQNEKIVNDESVKDWLKINLNEGSNPFPVSTIQDSDKGDAGRISKIMSNDASQQFKNSAVQTNMKEWNEKEGNNSFLVSTIQDSDRGSEERISKITSNDKSQQLKNSAVQTNIKEWNQRQVYNPQMAVMQAIKLKQSDDIKESEESGNSNAVKTIQQQTSSLNYKDLGTSGLGNPFSTENASVENLLKLKANKHHFSETLKHGNEKSSANDGQKQLVETRNGVVSFKTISSPYGDGLRNIREDNEDFLKGIGGVRRLQKLGGVIHLRLADNENLHHREKRQLVAIPHNNWCPVMSMRRNGHLDCTMWTFKKLCTIYCHSGYSYDGKGTAEMSCSRRQNKWTSDVNKPCTGSGREMPSSERIEKPAKGNSDNSKEPAPGPAPKKPPPVEGKPQKVPPKVPAPANAEENDDYYEEDYYQ